MFSEQAVFQGQIGCQFLQCRCLSAQVFLLASICLTGSIARQPLLAYYDFPAEHWDHLRTSNPIESEFATLRHRTVRTKGTLSQKTARQMDFTLVRAAAKKWRNRNGKNQLPRVIEGVKFGEGIADPASIPARTAPLDHAASARFSHSSSERRPRAHIISLVAPRFYANVCKLFVAKNDPSKAKQLPQHVIDDLCWRFARL